MFSAILVYIKIFLSNCSRNEWNPKWSVVILSDLHKIVWWQSEVWFVTQGYEIQTELDNTRSCYQLIKSMTKFLETNKFSSLFVYNNKTPALVKGTTTTCTHDVSNYIGLTSILFDYTVSHKYDAYTVFIGAQIKLVKTSRVQEFCYSLNLAQKETLKKLKKNSDLWWTENVQWPGYK